MTSSPPSLLALHIQRETRLWELQRNSSRPPTSFASTLSTITGTPLFSDAGGGDDEVGSISSLATTVDAEDPDELPQPQAALLALLHHHQNQNQHIPVYASLDEAVAAQSAIGQPGVAGPEHHQQPRRLTTPGKLYENEEEDDEIFEYEHEYGDDVVATG